MLFDAHWHAFRVFGGVPGRGKPRDVNARFKAMASHYVFEPEFCNPATGWEKGQVEKTVRDARNRLWQVMLVFKDLEELNQWLEDRCIALWSETAHRELLGSINMIVVMFEETAIVTIIGIFDILASGKTAFGTAQWSPYYIEVFLFVAAIYWVFIFSLGQYGEYLKGRMAISEH